MVVGMSHDVTIPAFARPLRVDPATGDFLTVEQDSEQDVMDCVSVLLGTVAGQREELMAYGISDILFSTDIDLNEIMSQIQEWEPRAITTLDLDYDDVDSLIQTLRVQVGMV
jgi:hypothetical protein